MKYFMKTRVHLLTSTYTQVQTDKTGTEGRDSSGTTNLKRKRKKMSGPVSCVEERKKVGEYFLGPKLCYRFHTRA